MADPHPRGLRCVDRGLMSVFARYRAMQLVMTKGEAHRQASQQPGRSCASDMGAFPGMYRRSFQRLRKIETNVTTRLLVDVE